MHGFHEIRIRCRLNNEGMIFRDEVMLVDRGRNEKIFGLSTSAIVERDKNIERCFVIS